MEEASKRVVHHSLPANYVTLVDLRERWMQKQKQKKLDEDTRNEALPIPIPLNVDVRDDDVAAEGKDGGVGDGVQLEKNQDQLPEKSVVVLSNPNPKYATRISSHGGNRRPIETRSCRWMQASQPKPPPLQAPPVVHLDEAKALPPVIRVSQSKVESAVESRGGIRSFGRKVDGAKMEEKLVHNANKKLQAPSVVQLDEAKALPPVIRVSQSKQPPLEAVKVESHGGIRSSGRKVDEEKKEKKLVPNANKMNNKDGEFDILVENVDDRKLDGVKMEEKKSKWNKRNYLKKKNVVVLDPNDDGEGKKILERGFEDGSGNKNMDDNTRAEVEDKFAGLSLSRGKGENSGDRSIVVRNRQGRIRGGHGKFEGRVMNERRNNKKDVAQLQPEGGVLDPNEDGGGNKIPGPGFEDGGGNKNVDEAEGKLAGERSGGGLITVRNRSGGIRGGGRGGRSTAVRDWCGGIRGGHGKFERGVVSERTRREIDSGLVWVKKGEASEIGAVPVEEAGNKRG